ncbi:MAG: TetR/AcrR family transcriptional regulator [Cyclobacteriaceae bacterium]
MKSKKYWDIYNKAKDLFWKYGFKRVSIEEICREAGVSKMTFYKFFPNKTELVKTLIGDILDHSLDEFHELVAQDISFNEKLAEIFKMKLKGTTDISPELIQELYQQGDKDLSLFFESRISNSQQAVVAFYQQAQEDGYIRADVKIDFIMLYSAQMMELMKNQKLLNQYPTTQDFIMETMNLLFYGIVTRNE